MTGPAVTDDRHVEVGRIHVRCLEVDPAICGPVEIGAAPMTGPGVTCGLRGRPMSDTEAPVPSRSLGPARCPCALATGGARWVAGLVTERGHPMRCAAILRRWPAHVDGEARVVPSDPDEC